MKVLILSCNTGQGHNTASRALAAEFERRGIYSEMLDALAFDSEFVSKFICNTYTKSTLHVPNLYAMGLSVAESIERYSSNRSLCYIANMQYAKKLYEYITEHGYDTIILPHVFPTETLTRIRRKYKDNLKTYFIATDYAYPLFLKETEIDGYFIPHASLIDQFAFEGIDRRKIIPAGIPVSDAFAHNKDKTEARRELGLPESGNVVLVMTGSMGFGPAGDILRELVPRCRDTEIVVMGGNNEKLKASLRSEFSDTGFVRVLDFTKRVSLYMDAADILFTKPGGLSSTEAAVKGIPIIHTKPIPGWEEDNVNFFVKCGMSLTGKNAKELAGLAAELLDSPKRREEMIANQHHTINRHAARDICSRIISCGKEALHEAKALG